MLEVRRPLHVRVIDKYHGEACSASVERRASRASDAGDQIALDSDKRPSHTNDSPSPAWPVSVKHKLKTMNAETNKNIPNGCVF
ncbi:hypothetical protein J6590_063606 [Homalodisca vitripennis]|nr:hypothetical protein J6590_063606 [Homalodisca vitripennis]